MMLVCVRNARRRHDDELATGQPATAPLVRSRRGSNHLARERRPFPLAGILTWRAHPYKPAIYSMEESR
jgi:hypothetical protein